MKNILNLFEPNKENKTFNIVAKGGITPLDNYDGVVGKALLEYRVGINEHCATRNPLGGCRVMECLYCDNCYYKITLENGEAISTTDVDLDIFDNKTRGFEDDNYEILFYDYIPNIDDLFSYLFDENSQFKMVRINDNQVMVDHVRNQQKLVRKRNNMIS